MKTTNITTRWYTTAFVSNALREYLGDHGYRIIEENEEEPSNSDEVVVASKFFGKEVIEIRGTIVSEAPLKEETESGKRIKLLTDAMYWLSDVLLSPITFFANNYSDGKNRSLCLPDLPHYRELLEKVTDYFTTNNLNLKVYLVSEDGSIEVTYLNTILAKRNEELNTEEKDNEEELQ